MKKPVFTSLFLLVSCFNPFFPPTGPPSGSGRDVIGQLERSYENQQITLFTELLSETFRFYVSPAFVSEYGYESYIQSEVIADSEYYFVPGKEYHYWTANEEKKSHEQLFKSAESIQFSSNILQDTNFIIKKTAYKRDTTLFDTVYDTSYIILDSIDNIDTLVSPRDTTVTDTSYDTTNLEIRMTNGNIVINLEAPIEENLVYTIDIGEQVFYLMRDPEDTSLWVIDKWFDLGTASN